MYKAYITRASTGDADNGPVIEAILALRREQANLTGYANYAEFSLASKVLYFFLFCCFFLRLPPQIGNSAWPPRYEPRRLGTSLASKVWLPAQTVDPASPSACKKGCCVPGD